MTAITVHTPDTLSRFVEIVEGLQRSAGTPLWFRGAGNDQHKLLPSLYRHPKLPKGMTFDSLEQQILSRFRQRGLPYHSRDLRDDWDAMFFMQHYGVPTRLLDWTENPFVALYFCLMTAPFTLARSGERQYRQTAAVWVWNPTIWNRTSLAHVSFAGGPLSQSDPELRGYASSSGPVSNLHPVAMYGAHNSARIVAQQGVFALFGKSRDSMESLIEGDQFPPESLQKITMTSNKIGLLRASMLNHGITESTVFPDLDGLARETKRHFGFEN